MTDSSSQSEPSLGHTPPPFSSTPQQSWPPNQQWQQTPWPPGPYAAPPSPSSGKTVIIVVCIAVGLALVAGVSVLTFLLTREDGPENPEEAVEQYLEAFNSEDEGKLSDLSCKADHNYFNNFAENAEDVEVKEVDITYKVTDSRRYEFSGYKDGHAVTARMDGRMLYDDGTQELYNNELIQLPVVKEDDEWKVCLTLIP